MKICEISTLMEILLRHVEQVHGIDEVSFGDLDYYWTTPSREWLSMGKPPDVVVGSLLDDEAELRRVLADQSRATALDIERLAALLRLLSDQVVGWDQRVQGH